MSTYVMTEGGRYVCAADSSVCPETTRVTAMKLVVGDILIFNDYGRRLKYSAAVTTIELAPGTTTKYHVTTIDGAGKVERHDGWKGSKAFERQCSHEQVQQERERTHNIVLRRQLESLRKDVSESIDGITKRLKGWKDYSGHKHPGIENPKVVGYLASMQAMEQSIRSMYLEVGADLGIKPSVKKTKKRRR